MSSEGIESAWELITTLHVSSNGLAIVDPMSWDSVTVDLEPGSYDVWIRTITLRSEGIPRVARVRVTRTRGGIVAGTIQRVGTDVATLMILDAIALTPDLTDEVKAFEEKLTECWQSGEPTGIAKWGYDEEAIAAFVQTGLGDGTFDVKEVLKADQRIGFEIEFIDPEG